MKGPGAIQLGSGAGKHRTEGSVVLLTWGKRGKWRFFLSCSVELPHQSSNTCRLAWPWNWGAEVGHRELLHASPPSLLCSANLSHGPRHWSTYESKGRCHCFDALV